MNSGGAYFGVIVLVVLLLLGGHQIGDDSMSVRVEQTLGATISELEGRKLECELNIPRSKVCVAEVRFHVKEN